MHVNMIGMKLLMQIMADPSLLNTQSDSSDSEEDSDRFVSTSRLWHEERRMVKQQINKNQIESNQKSNNRALRFVGCSTL